MDASLVRQAGYISLRFHHLLSMYPWQDNYHFKLNPEFDTAFSSAYVQGKVQSLTIVKSETSNQKTSH